MMIKRSLSSLPEDVLVLILQHVKLQQRLQACARLSSKFHRAAVRASTDIVTCPRYWAPAFVAWLMDHGSILTSLSFKLTECPAPFVLHELPCTRLRSLDLTDGHAQLTADGNQQGLQQCTALSRLHLQNCNVIGSLQGLSALRDLQHLQVSWDEGNVRFPQAVSLLPGSLLSQLLQLTHIQLSSPIRFASLQHLSCLTRLRVLLFALAADAAQEELSGVQHLQQLHGLYITCNAAQHISLEHTPDLVQMTNLRVLALDRCRALDASVLWRMAHLRYLSLQQSTLVGEAAGTSTLLAMLPDLTSLESLELAASLQHIAPQTSAYTALAALRHLRQLVLPQCRLPGDLWQQMAAAHLHWPHVSYLDINYTTPQLDASGLDGLVKGFPHLLRLSCVSAVAPDTDMSALQKLHLLTSLGLNNVSDEDVYLLATLQSLNLLHIRAPSNITDLGMLQLTALSQLTQLRCSGHLSHAILGAATADAGDKVVITNRAPAVQQVTDVPKQLMLLCMHSDACKAVLWEELQGTRSQLVAARAGWEASNNKVQALLQDLHSQQTAAANWEAKAVEAAAHEGARHNELGARETEVRRQEAELQKKQKLHATWEDELSRANTRLQANMADMAAQQRAVAMQADIRAAQLDAFAAQLDAREAQLRRMQAAMQAGAAPVGWGPAPGAAPAPAAAWGPDPGAAPAPAAAWGPAPGGGPWPMGAPTANGNAAPAMQAPQPGMQPPQPMQQQLQPPPMQQPQPPPMQQPQPPPMQQPQLPPMQQLQPLPMQQPQQPPMQQQQPMPGMAPGMMVPGMRPPGAMGGPPGSSGPVPGGAQPAMPGFMPPGPAPAPAVAWGPAPGAAPPPARWCTAFAWGAALGAAPAPAVAWAPAPGPAVAPAAWAPAPGAGPAQPPYCQQW